MQFDAVLVLSFGGPDGPDDVRPFLENVLRSRPVTPERFEEVAQHYMRFGGRSPINELNRTLTGALETELASHGNARPVYWGNRNWHPLLTDTVAQMRDDGIERAAVFVTSAYSSYSSCRQYVEDIARAREAVGAGAPEIAKLPPFFDRPGFVEPFADGLRAALEVAGPGAPVLMSAHSIPASMAAACDYEEQLKRTARLVAHEAGLDDASWSMAFQSRSGPPSQPWLGPDVSDAIRSLPPATGAVVVVPIGFVSDHMEVVYDLDVQAQEVAAGRGIRLVRTATPGTDPRFVDMVVELLDEALPDEAPTCPCQPGRCSPAAR